MHERSRGGGTFAEARAGLATARHASIPRLGVVVTVHGSNQGELPGLPAFLDRIGVTECYLSPFKKTGQQGSRAPWDPPDPARLAATVSSLTCERRD